MESDEMIPIEIKYEGEDIDLEDELNEVAEFPPPKKAKTKSKNKTNNKDNKRRRTSYVWSFFELLSTKDEEKPTCKCKKCGKEYIVAEAYGTENLKCHLELCPRKDTRDVGQLILGQNAMNLIPFIVWIWVGRHKKHNWSYTLDEPRVDCKTRHTCFWKGNEFRYPELVAMVCDFEHSYFYCCSGIHF
ncbi:hypothetical protein ACB092_02G083500 [Castanea dentata]